MILFLKEPATTEIYTLSLHDALPILRRSCRAPRPPPTATAIRMATASGTPWGTSQAATTPDRKSTRLNSSHPSISYAVFCLKKKMMLDVEQPHADRAGESHQGHVHQL